MRIHRDDPARPQPAAEAPRSSLREALAHEVSLGRLKRALFYEYVEEGFAPQVVARLLHSLVPPFKQGQYRKAMLFLFAMMTAYTAFRMLGIPSASFWGVGAVTPALLISIAYLYLGYLSLRFSPGALRAVAGWQIFGLLHLPTRLSKIPPDSALIDFGLTLGILVLAYFLHTRLYPGLNWLGQPKTSPDGTYGFSSLMESDH